MAKVKSLVITGYGLNCEAETSFALRKAGAETALIHLNDLIAGKEDLDRFHLLALVGGFSFGDHVSAGRVFANRLGSRLRAPLRRFIERGRLIIGICNGFQTMVKLGLLPGFDGDYETQLVTLAANDSGVFRDAWVTLKVDPRSPCVFTRGMERLQVPIRHGEGKFCVREPAVMERLKEQGQVALRYADPETGEPAAEYPHNPNGSLDAVAGLCDPSGRIFGLMPHPEAHHSPYNHPQWTRRKIRGNLPAEGEGLRIFRNAVELLAGEV